jgi:hypothetical protein
MPMIPRASEERGIRFVPANQLQPRSVSWLWPGRLARGKLSILEGDPGLGKTLVCLDLCARLTIGRAFPDGSPGAEPANAIVLEAEDDKTDTTIPRLQAMGADVSRIFVAEQRDTGLWESLNFPADLGKLDEVLTTSQAALVIMSPISEFLEGCIVSNNEGSVRRVLSPLAKLAEKHGCVMLLVRHLNKRTGGQAVYRGGGSISFIAACRSGWLVGRDPENAGRSVLAQVKNNLASIQPSLAFEIQTGESGQPIVSWQGSCSWSADELLLAAGHAPLPSGARAEAGDFLIDLLSDEPKTSREVWEAVEESGLSKRTIERAKKDKEIRSSRVWLGGKQVSYWLLKGQELPETVPEEAKPADLEPWLAPLRREFPPPTPLDDL